ncbi:MAG: hypothetical protein H0T17_10480 [Propionibacteriales bacterium]|nr:hypothetical protein [Propionibacteriales bacterium]
MVYSLSAVDPDFQNETATLVGQYISSGLRPEDTLELGHANVLIALDRYSHFALDVPAIAATRIAALVTGDPQLAHA